MIEFDPVLVHDWLSRSAHRFPDKHALICGPQRWTYRALDDRSHRLAQALLAMGMQCQDRVVIFLDNSSETVVSLYGILKARGAFVIADGGVKSHRLKYVLADSGARLLITHTSKASVVLDSVAGLETGGRIVWVGPEHDIPPSLRSVSVTWDSLFAAVDASTPSKLPRTIDVDVAALIYTSATTGAPKGVVSTHHNMVSAARSIIQYINNSEDDIILNVLPLSFDYGLYQVIMAFMFGGTVVLEKSFLFPHEILQSIERHRVTGFPVMPTIVAILLRTRDFGKYDLGTLRYMTNTGAALPEKHIAALRSTFPWVRIFSMFGLTECKRTAYLPPEHIDAKPRSVGHAIPNCEVFIVDPTGHEVPAGETGELIVRGSNVMQGYWNDPETTRKTYHEGRYPADRTLHCGDYFRRDEQGFLYFVGRKDDMIKSGGERISPKEVENIICALSGVAEAAVVGVDDEVLGQAIMAFVVAAPDAAVTEQDVLRFCRENMPPRMVPRSVEVVESLPRTIHGKIDRRHLAGPVAPAAKPLGV
ncbi:MAG: AMP-binding protein [Sedimentisphaerales bacterium]|nr:AMP-binding protein [Sedimentisphaerales bacterium]